MRSIWPLEKTAQHQLQAKLQYGEVESDGVNFSNGKFSETIGECMWMDLPKYGDCQLVTGNRR